MSNINLLASILKDKKKLSTYILLMVLCVIFLFFYNIINNEDSSEEEINTSSTTTEYDYLNELEEKLSSLISKINNVGKVDIMITLEGTSIYQYAQEEEKSESDDTTHIETKYIITNDEDPILLSIENPQIIGVLIVCEGGDSDVVKEKIYNSVSVVLGIKRNQIYVSDGN